MTAVCDAIGFISGSKTAADCEIAAAHGIDPWSVILDAAQDTTTQAGQAVTETAASAVETIRSPWLPVALGAGVVLALVVVMGVRRGI